MNNTLIKGLGVIELLAHSERPLGLSEIAAELGLAKSNVHRLLQALTELRYVIRAGDGSGYSASIKLWELGSAVLSRLDLRRHAEIWMDQLMHASGESVHLSVLDRGEVVYVHKIDSPNPVRAYTQIGGRALAHCVATGKAMLAFLPEATLQRMAAALVPSTPHSIVEPARFLREMEKIRKQGYAVNRGEWRETVSGIAAPITDCHGHVIAAVGLSGPAERFRPGRLKPFADMVQEAAAEITASLGGGSHDALALATRSMADLRRR
ncbi:IclR family transcriptional regulator [Cupriavidus sp. USMAA2-4]|uniref:IclR family transcriptional regulator n=1 Tax=Cupriavidus malaysiensis TaxID=367825 RepID=A0A1D9IDS8_9BURK|nr:MULTISPECIES: IclR family transcriptional regulator [Cupriavidus]AOY94774.1 IclR family transcriptional regulator [Cupriavidus sp. USMAA2-4]AOZ02365.1 IclR family transcriptional regulator [Cupriavidus sp. USMAHM13]AOZ10262.1 IclR family transcriptional regulator [Cupriavidus malaysiensis]